MALEVRLEAFDATHVQALIRELNAELNQRYEQEAAALGYTSLKLETGLAQPEAIALYESEGWSEIPGYGPWASVDFTRYYGKVVRADGLVG